MIAIFLNSPSLNKILHHLAASSSYSSNLNIILFYFIY